MARLFAVLLLVGAFVLGAPHLVFAQEPSVAEFVTTLENAATALENGDMAEAESLLGTLRSGTLENGESVNLADEIWDTLLEQPPETAAATLRALAERLSNPPATLPDDSRAQLERVLARPEFQPPVQTPWDQFLQWLWERIEEFLEWFSQFLPDSTPDSRAFFNVVVGIIGVIVIGLLLFFVVRMLGRNLHRGDTLESLGAIPVHATEAQSQAASAANAGDFREALRLLYLTALLHLDEVGLLRFDRALTNREVLATVATRAPLYNVLSPVVTQFDRVWYGHAPFGAPEFEEMQARIEQLRQMKGTSR